MKAAIVISAGFKETGGEGVGLERALLETARKAKVRVLGPNCLGLINTHARLNASFAAGTPPAGAISFFSQSGALCTAILDWAIGENVGFSKFVSLGNKADLSESDVMEFLATDPETRVILGYVESIDDGIRFLRVSREVTARKPVIIVKAGSTAAGARAASSHTGSLAGSDRAYAAAFRQGGVLRAETVEDLFDLALGFAMQPMPRGERLLILTNAGGPGILAADMAEKLGIPLAEVSPELRERLSGSPPTASLGNPVDVIGDAQADRYLEALRHPRGSAIDAVLVLLTPQAMTQPEGTARAAVRPCGLRQDRLRVVSRRGLREEAERFFPGNLALSRAGEGRACPRHARYRRIQGGCRRPICRESCTRRPRSHRCRACRRENAGRGGEPHHPEAYGFRFRGTRCANDQEAVRIRGDGRWS
jgi:acetyltransferase